jgi:hypothetical protein
LAITPNWALCSKISSFITKTVSPISLWLS